MKGHDKEVLEGGGVTVDKVKVKVKRLYRCEFSGDAYTDLKTAEVCEEYCSLHEYYSHEIVRTAAYKPRIRAMSVAA